MIGELILIGVVAATIGYLISKFKTMRENRKMLNDIEEKVKNQKEMFYADGKELSIYEKEVKDVVAPSSTRPKTKPKKVIKKIDNGRNKKK